MDKSILVTTLFVDIRSIWHTDYKSTREKLASFGLEIET